MNLRLDRLAQRLETERLVLRSFEPADASLLFDLVEASRAFLEPWLLFPERMTSRLAVEQWAARPYEASEAYRMGMFTKVEGRLVGACGLKVRSLEPKSTWYWVDVNYWLAPHEVGRGYATEAARRLALHALEDLEAPRVEIRVEPNNERSARVAERLGFRREGVLRAVGLRRGRPSDLLLFALLAEERQVLAEAPST